MKAKSVIMYVLSMIFVIMLTSSFNAEFHFNHTGRVNLSPKVMYLAFIDDLDSIVSKPDDSDSASDSVKAQQYSKGDSSRFVRQYRYVLYYLDLLGNPVSNEFDTDMEAAVLSYQQTRGLDVNGVLNLQTMNALDSEEPTYRQGQKGNEILAYQQTLKALKYISENAEINGDFDDITYEAVKKYQQNHSLEVTGTLDKPTQIALKRDLSLQTPMKSE